MKNNRSMFVLSLIILPLTAHASEQKAAAAVSPAPRPSDERYASPSERHLPAHRRSVVPAYAMSAAGIEQKLSTQRLDAFQKELLDQVDFILSKISEKAHLDSENRLPYQQALKDFKYLLPLSVSHEVIHGIMYEPKILKDGKTTNLRGIPSVCASAVILRDAGLTYTQPLNYITDSGGKWAPVPTYADFIRPDVQEALKDIR